MRNLETELDELKAEFQRFKEETSKMLLEIANKKVREKKRPLHDFEQSPYFRKSLFEHELFSIGWSIEKIDHYYNAALDYSKSTGKKYCDWLATIKIWDRKTPFKNGTTNNTEKHSANLQRLEHISNLRNS